MNLIIHWKLFRRCIDNSVGGSIAQPYKAGKEYWRLEVQLWRLRVAKSVVSIQWVPSLSVMENW